MDFGLLKNLRIFLLGTIQTMNLGVKQVYLSPPNTTDFPLIFLEIEEIWTSYYLVKDSPCGKIKIKASFFSKSLHMKESISIASMIKYAIDGKTIILDDNKRSICKFSKSLIDLPQNSKPAHVQQYFDFLIRA